MQLVNLEKDPTEENPMPPNQNRNELIQILMQHIKNLDIPGKTDELKISGCRGQPAGPLRPSKTAMTFQSYNEANHAITRFIERGEGEFDKLAFALHQLQAKHVPAIAALCQNRGIDSATLDQIDQIQRSHNRLSGYGDHQYPEKIGRAILNPAAQQPLSPASIGITKFR